MRAGRATVVLDGDQTLWDFRSAMVRSLGETRIEMSRHLGAPLDDMPSIARLIEIRDEVAAGSRETDLYNIRRLAFAQTLRSIGTKPDNDVVDHLTEFFMGRRFELCRPYPDTVPALTVMRQGFTVVLLTNGNSHPERMGLRSMFDHIFVAEELGASKPDAAVYAAVVAACGAGDYVSVGDSLMNDIVAPQKAGWKAIWINRDGRPLPPQVHPNATMPSLDGIDVALRVILN